MSDDILGDILSELTGDIKPENPITHERKRKIREPSEHPDGICHLDGEPCVHRYKYYSCSYLYDGKLCKQYAIVRLQKEAMGR